MIRSGKAILPAVWAGAVIGAAALAAATERHLVLAGALAAAWVIAFALLVRLARRADPVDLGDRSRDYQRDGAALGRAMGKASGGWDLRPSPPTRRPREERKALSPAENAGELREDR